MSEMEQKVEAIQERLLRLQRMADDLELAIARLARLARSREADDGKPPHLKLAG